MTSEEIRLNIETIGRAIEALKASTSKALEEYEISGEGEVLDILVPKLDRDIFNEIRELADALYDCDYRTLKAHSDTTTDLKRIKRAIDSGLLYMDLLMSEDDVRLEDILVLAEDNYKQATALSKEMRALRTDLYRIAWRIYFEKLDSKELLSETKLLADSFKIKEEDIGAEGFREPTSERGIIVKPAEKSRNIAVDIETPYMRGVANYMTTAQYDELSVIEKRERLREIIEPYFAPYIKAIESKGDSRCLFRANNNLARAIDQLLDLGNAQTISSPSVAYAFTDKVTQSLPKIEIGKETPINLAKQKDRDKGLNIPVIVRLDGDYKEPIYVYDLEVLSTVLTCWENGVSEGIVENGIVTVTLQEFYRQLYLLDEDARLESEEERQKLIDSLMKLTRITQSLDATSEGEHYKKYPELANFSRVGPMVTVYVDRSMINGSYADLVHIANFDMSPQYLYSKAKNQIISTERKKLTSKAVGKKGKAKGKTSEYAIIERYLWRRIETRKKQGYGILLSSIMEYADIDLSKYKDPKSKKKNTVKKITDILNGFVAEGYIKSWSYERKGKEKYYKFVFVK